MTPEEAVSFARATLLEPVLALLQRDGHSWSSRPCTTCEAITSIVGKPFGCVVVSRRKS